VDEQQAGREAQDAVLDAAERRALFRSRAFEIFERLPAGEYTGEDIRLAIQAEGVEPDHVNAWGAFIGTLARGEDLHDTGRVRAMRARGSHGRRTPIYQKRTGPVRVQGVLFSWEG